MEFKSNEFKKFDVPGPEVERRIDSKEDFDKQIRIEIKSFLNRHPGRAEKAVSSEAEYKELFMDLAVIFSLKDDYLDSMIKEVLGE